MTSTKCSDRCCQGRARYDGLASWTRANNHSNVWATYSLFSTSGIISTDTLQVGGIEVTKQLFEEAITMCCPPMTQHVPFDGSRGLAPSKAGAANNMTNPFLEMVSRGLLDENVFTLHLPRSERSETGELAFGGIDEDKSSGDLVRLPVVDRTVHHDQGRSRDDRWQVEARWQSVGDGHGVNSSLDGYVAVFQTGLPMDSHPLEDGGGHQKGRRSDSLVAGVSLFVVTVETTFLM